MDNLSQSEELIERYISDEMSPVEKRAFENKMDADSDLSEEVSFQKDIINALKSDRKAALKARMDNVKIPSPYSSYYTAGIASVVLIGGIAFLTTLWPVEFNEEQPLTNQQTEIAAPESKTNSNESEKITESDYDNGALAEEEDEMISEPNPDHPREEIISMNNESGSDVVSNKSLERQQPNISTPNAPDPGSDSGFTTSSLESGSSEILNTDKRKTAKVEVEIKSSQDYNFHYQHFNNKLFLYGDFSKSPYELIELNSDNSKNLYLYFSGKYYALNSNQVEVSKLTPLRDKIIVKGLDNLRLR